MMHLGYSKWFKLSEDCFFDVIHAKPVQLSLFLFQGCVNLLPWSEITRMRDHATKNLLFITIPCSHEG